MGKVEQVELVWQNKKKKDEVSRWRGGQQEVSAEKAKITLMAHMLTAKAELNYISTFMKYTSLDSMNWIYFYELAWIN